MYIYDRKSLGARSLPKNAYYPDRVLDGFWGAEGTNDSFSPACDRSVATPRFFGRGARQADESPLTQPKHSSYQMEPRDGTRLNLAYDLKTSSLTWLVTWILPPCELLSKNPEDHTRSAKEP